MRTGGHRQTAPPDPWHGTKPSRLTAALRHRNNSHAARAPAAVWRPTRLTCRLCGLEVAIQGIDLRQLAGGGEAQRLECRWVRAASGLVLACRLQLTASVASSLLVAATTNEPGRLRPEALLLSASRPGNAFPSPKRHASVLSQNKEPTCGWKRCCSCGRLSFMEGVIRSFSMLQQSGSQVELVCETCDAWEDVGRAAASQRSLCSAEACTLTTGPPTYHTKCLQP